MASRVQDRGVAFMKIHNDGLQGTNPLETGRTQGPEHLDRASGLPGQRIAGHEGDSVQISGISQYLAESNALESKQRGDRVQELTALYAKGNYQVNATALSRKLISNSISPSEGGQK